MLKQLIQKLPPHIRFLSSVYFCGIVLFTIPRLILLSQHGDKLVDVPGHIVWQALWMGFRFDTVVSGYFLLLPFLLLTIFAFWGKTPVWMQRCVQLLLVGLYSVGLFIAAADIPYFNYFNARMTISALKWADSPELVSKMIFQDVHYYPYFLLFFFLTGIFAFIVSRLMRKYLAAYSDRPRPASGAYYGKLLMLSLLTAILLFIGIRGRVAAKSPIRWGTAFFSTYAFPNQLGLNPVFTFLRSWVDARKPGNQQLKLMDDQIALANVQRFLNIVPDSGFASPIARTVEADTAIPPQNVVLILMENMAAKKMGIFGNPGNLTPHLDSLAVTQSYFFRNFYGAGIHTYNGIYASLFGLPTILNKHPMKTTESMQAFGGLARALRQHAYQTIFFSTHDEQFDNMGGFLSTNGFQEIISEKDYPSDEVLTALGVPDHYMLNFALPHLQRLHKNDAPFLATLLTASDHGPYVIPEDIDFRADSEDIRQQIVEYADWALGQFMAAARDSDWYKNTIFIFVADHGSNIDPVYDLSLPYHHIPLIVHMPGKLQKSVTMDGLGGQIDLYPTILGLLQLSFVNNTLGIDLFRESREEIFFSADDKLGCINDSLFWVGRPNGGESLYRYKEKDRTDWLKKYPAETKQLKTYAESMLQATQWLIDQKLVGPQGANEQMSK